MSVMSTGAVMVPNLLMANTENLNNKGILKGFIVSDAHFGWDAKGRSKGMQPTPLEQQEAPRL